MPAHLRVLDDQGQVHDECPACAEWARKYNGLLSQLGRLRADRDAEARAHEAWPTCVRLFVYWTRKTGHPKAEFTPERFFLAQPLLKRFGVEACVKAIDGAAFDPYVTKRRNGSLEKHNGFDLIFRSASKLEGFCERVPEGWKPPRGCSETRDEGRCNANRTT